MVAFVSRGGSASRDKGARMERAIVHALQGHSLAAERVPLSGAAHGRFGGDISVPALGRDLRGEAKCRLIVAKLELAAEIMRMAEHAKEGAP
jgi:Holliday junction resolvase